MRQALGSLFKKPATVMYPFVKVSMPERFRGKLKFDSTKCIGCKLCMRDCPAGAIRIEKVADKTFEAHFDFSRCIYCAQCVDSCPKKAIEATGEYELARLTRADLQQTFHAQPKPAAETPAPTPAEPAEKPKE